MKKDSVLKSAIIGRVAVILLALVTMAFKKWGYDLMPDEAAILKEAIMYLLLSGTAGLALNSKMRENKKAKEEATTQKPMSESSNGPLSDA